MVVVVTKGEANRETKKEQEKKFKELYAPKIIRTYEENGHRITVYENRAAINFTPNWIKPTSKPKITLEL